MFTSLWRKLSFYILLICSTLSLGFALQAQVCTTTQYGKSYSYPGGAYQHFFYQLPDKSLVFGGPHNQTFLMMKTDANGKTIWSNEYSASSTYYQDVLTESLLDKDGNLVAAFHYDCIAKIDVDGKLLSAIRLTRPVNYIYFKALALLENGDKIVLVTDANSGGYFLLRLSADLTKVIWTQYFTDYGIYLQQITIDGNKIILPGRVNDRGCVLQFDAGTGHLVKQVWLTIADREVYFGHVYSYSDGYLVKGNLYKPSSSYDEENHIILRLDKDLNPIKSYRFANIDDYRSITLTVEADGSYYAGYGMNLNGFMKVNKEDSILWSRTNSAVIMTRPYHTLKTEEGLIMSSGANFVAAGTGIYSGFYALAKSDLNGNFINCPTIEDKIGKLDLSFQLLDYQRSSKDTSGILISDAAVTVTPGSLPESDNCKAVITCNNLKIIGPPVICTAGATSFVGRRNSGCSLPVHWKVEGDAVDQQEVNDSTLSIQFKQSGKYRLIAFLNSACTEIADTMDLQVTVNPSIGLSLGADMSLCPGNSMLLNAKKGFTSYAWQDGSRDSIFLVTNPGTYHIVVQDACGGEFRDTIIITAAPPIPFTLGADRVKCNNDTVQLRAPSGFLNYSWGPDYNASSSSGQVVVLNPAKDTAYYVRAEKTKGCYAFDTVYVKVNQSPKIYLGRDTSFCAGGSVLLQAGAGFTRYVWNDGSATVSKLATVRGSYWVKAWDNNNCMSTDTLSILEVYKNPVVRLGKDSLLCFGDTRVLDAGSSFTSYVWNTGSSDQKLRVTTLGKYTVKVIDKNGCRGSDSVSIIRMISLPSNFLPGDATICSYGSLDLTPTKAFSNYLWNTGATTTTLTIKQPGTYWLEVKDKDGCKGRDTVVVNLQQCMEGFYIASAFTPNNDGKNDLFRPLLFGKVTKFKFSIFNRYGGLVFETSDLQKGWDGKAAGVEEGTHAYVWTCEYQFEGKEKKVEKGTVTLLR